MKLAPRGGMMTSLVEVNGRTVAAGWEGGAAAALLALETSAIADSANAGIPARAKDAVAAPFNKWRREILSMIGYLSAVGAVAFILDAHGDTTSPFSGPCGYGARSADRGGSCCSRLEKCSTVHFSHRNLR